MGVRLRAWRDERELTQQQAADAAGISQSAWSEIEQGGLSHIGLDTAQRIVDVTCGEVSLGDFPRPKGKRVRPVPAPSSATLPESEVEDDALHGRESA